MKEKIWFVYIIQNEKGHLYTGITTDLARRFEEHAKSPKGAKFFNTGAPKKILFSKEFEGRGPASKYEYMVKQLTRKKKLELISSKGKI